MEYASTWQRHRAKACFEGCYYCVMRDKIGEQYWTLIAPQDYADVIELRRKQVEGKS